jgi:hypothetical protein
MGSARAQACSELDSCAQLLRPPLGVRRAIRLVNPKKAALIEAVNPLNRDSYLSMNAAA